MTLVSDATLIFDLDGTLVDTAPDLVHAVNHAIADVDLPPAPASMLRPFIAFGARRMLAEALKAAGRGEDEGELDRLLERFMVYYADNIAVESLPFPGVVATLDRLRAAGARLGVCTNKREAMSRKLFDALGLNSHFGAIVGRDTLDVCKPHPRHLTETIARVGGRAERAIMIGDSATDIATARAANVPVVAVSFGYTGDPAEIHDADIVIDHYDEMADALTTVLGQGMTMTS